VEKDDLFDLESKVDELKDELETIHSELDAICSKLSDIECAILDSNKDDFELSQINGLKSLQERTNEILSGIESNTWFIKLFAWLCIGAGVLSLLKGCFGW
jgi:predicted  nucleic acid-binding Zn-ribbon protein